MKMILDKQIHVALELDSCSMDKIPDNLVQIHFPEKKFAKWLSPTIFDELWKSLMGALYIIYQPFIEENKNDPHFEQRLFTKLTGQLIFYGEQLVKFIKDNEKLLSTNTKHLLAHAYFDALIVKGEEVHFDIGFIIYLMFKEGYNGVALELAKMDLQNHQRIVHRTLDVIEQKRINQSLGEPIYEDLQQADEIFWQKQYHQLKRRIEREILQQTLPVTPKETKGYTVHQLALVHYYLIKAKDHPPPEQQHSNGKRKAIEKIAKKMNISKNTFLQKFNAILKDYDAIYAKDIRKAYEYLQKHYSARKALDYAKEKFKFFYTREQLNREGFEVTRETADTFCNHVTFPSEFQ